MASQLELPIRSSPRFPDLEEVAHLRVTESNPPSSSDNNGLDYERCSALHNAIVKHGWRASGHSVAEMPQSTWWQSAHNAPYLTDVQQKLHPSLVEFLRRAIDITPFTDNPDSNSLFYYCNALAHPDHSYLYEQGEEDLVALYSAGGFKSRFRDGIVCVTRRHVHHDPCLKIVATIRADMPVSSTSTNPWTCYSPSIPFLGSRLSLCLASTWT